MEDDESVRLRAANESIEEPHPAAGLDIALL